MIDRLRQDLSYALRGLRRSPGLTAATLVSFGLGIGVNAALFTVVDRVFFQAPPGVVEPGQVRRLSGFSRNPARRQVAEELFTTKDLLHLGEVANGVARIEGYYRDEGRSIGNDPQRRTVAYATPGFFELAGVRPYLGRFPGRDENRIGRPTNVGVISYGYWRRGFAGDTTLIGRAVRVDSALLTVIGIAPPRFEGMDLDVVELWAPLASVPRGLEGDLLNGDFNILQLFARLVPGIDALALQARLNVQYRRDREFSLQRDSTIYMELAPLLQARSAVGLGFQQGRNLALLQRVVAIGLVVLIVAVTNVASLLLMRALRRRREIAIRVALGISRARLASQMLVESVLLAVMGGGVALLIAWWSGGVLRTLFLSSVHWTSTVIDGRVVVVTLAAAVAAGALAGLAPASVALRRNVMSALKSGSAEAGRSRSRGRVALLVTQTALCMLMLAAAGVFVQSLRKAMNIDLGFDADRLIMFTLFRIDENVADQAVQRIRAMPQVASVTRSGMDARGGGTFGVRFVNGDSIPMYEAPMGGFVDTAFAGALGLRVLNGRTVNASDMRGSEPVAVINDAMARAYWKRRDPVGDCFHVGRPADPCRRIVGVVGTTRWFMTAEPQKAFYMPAAQAPWPRCCTTVTVRTRGRVTPAIAADIRRIVSDLPGRHPDYPPNPRLVVDGLAPQFRPWRVAASTFFVFGMLALCAAASGIYGLVGYDVTQRTHEFGVRITLGSTAGGIMRLVLASGFRVVAIGLAAGIASAMIAGRLIASLLFETSPYDPFVLAITSATLAAVALIASLVPAWRATRVDPVVALRAE